MSRTRRFRLQALAGLAFGLSALAGCQTYYEGMTLPSPRYLDHPPTYIPESPPFPLTRELATMQAQSAAIEASTPAAPNGLPPRVPGGQ